MKIIIMTFVKDYAYDNNGPRILSKNTNQEL